MDHKKVLDNPIRWIYSNSMKDIETELDLLRQMEKGDYKPCMVCGGSFLPSALIDGICEDCRDIGKRLSDLLTSARMDVI